MEFLSEYGLFLAKAVTIVVALVVVIGAATALGGRHRREHEGHIEITQLNDRYNEWENALKDVVLDEKTQKAAKKEEKKQAKLRKKQEKQEKVETTTRKRVFVLDFHGDIRASAVENLRQEITAVLTVAQPSDEVLLKLESGGGLVHSYGLAASQLQRIVDRGIPLTVAVDRVAASGGYMMACIGQQILAAPFAVLGSIGVLAQLPNFHRLLKKHDIDFELHTAGEFKRTLTMFGENTDDGREKFLEELEDTHVLFKEFVAEHRPQVSIDDVATGEVWFGRRAIDKRLVDKLQTSDDYLLSQRRDADLFAVHYTVKKSLPEKLGLATESAVDSAIGRWLGRLGSRPLT